MTGEKKSLLLPSSDDSITAKEEIDMQVRWVKEKTGQN